MIALPNQSSPLEFSTQIDLKAEKIVFWTIALVPLWWILGLQIAVYPLVGWYLFYRSLKWPGSISFPFGWNMWWTYIAVWLCSLVINLAMGVAEIGRSTTTLGSILGIWILMVIVWYAMRRCQVRYWVVVRAICVLGFCQLVAVGVGEAYLQATGSILQTQSLLFTLIPSLPASGFFEARLYGYDVLGWDVDAVPRLLAFYYWPPLAGTMSIFVCMAALNEQDRRWKGVAILGAVSTAYYSAARSGQVGITLALLISLWLGGGRWRQVLNWCFAGLAVASPIVFSQLYKYFFEYRADSAAARLALYDETFKYFLRSPLIGYGAHGRSEILEVPLGSHSQVYSTLYHTGVLGSAVLIVAWTAIAVHLLKLGFASAPTLGAWAGLTVAMFSGELEAASVTVFVLGVWLGCAWNRAEYSEQRPYFLDAQLEPPPPWQALRLWWKPHF